MFFVIVFYPRIKITNSLNFSSFVPNLKSTPSIIDSIMFLLFLILMMSFFFLLLIFSLQVLEYFLK